MAMPSLNRWGHAQELRPQIRPGGVYIREDIHGAFNRFSAYLYGLADTLNAIGNGFRGAWESLAFTPTHFKVQSDPFITIRSSSARTGHSCSRATADRRRGTQWIREILAPDSARKNATTLNGDMTGAMFIPEGRGPTPWQAPAWNDDHLRLPKSPWLRSWILPSVWRRCAGDPAGLGGLPDPRDVADRRWPTGDWRSTRPWVLGRAIHQGRVGGPGDTDPSSIASRWTI